jgi:hypothetical protein
VSERRRLGCQHLLRLVDFAVFEALESADLVERQFGEEAQEPADIGVFGVAPKLPVIEGAQPLRIEPDRALRGLAHLGAGGGGDERRRQSEQAPAVGTACQIDPGDDIAPLVRAAHLQLAAEAPRQLQKIVGLQNEVVEFEKAERLVAVEPEAHAVLRQHAVDREMAADIAQEWDVMQLVQPVGVVDHDRVAGAVAEMQVVGEDLADAGHVMGNRRIVEQLAGLVLAGGIADTRGAASHQHDRLIAGLLE